MGTNSIKIAPSLLACDFSKLGEEIRALETAGADVIHFDVMDGHFVPNITIGIPVMESVRKITQLPFDAHLMIENADDYLEPFAKAGCNWLSVHVEACPHLHRTVQKIKELGMKAGVAINPGTSLAALASIIKEVDYVLVMSVNPGFGGQSFIPHSLQRISELKKQGVPLIEVDGGIKEHNIGDIVKAGADVIVVGTGLFGLNKDYRVAVQQLRSAAGRG